MAKILWLHKRDMSTRQKTMLDGYISRVGLNSGNIYYTSLGTRFPKGIVYKTKITRIRNDQLQPEILKVLDEYIARTNPKVIVINEDIALAHMTERGYISLDMCRGSMYDYKGIPVIVVDDVLKIITVKHQAWVMINDLKKVRRWTDGIHRVQPRFNYTVCKDIVAADIGRKYLNECTFISTDIETIKGFITCVGYTGLHNDGSVHSYVYPLFVVNNNIGQGVFSVEDEIKVWKIIGEINNNDVPKVLQNGPYDCAYELRNNVPLKNYFFDTMQMWHSVWPEAPKKLNFIASILLDYYRYWKDELKGSKEENTPKTPEDWERYWRYNALDCYNTLLSGMELAKLLSLEPMKWARDNWAGKIELQMGPAFHMTMRGMALNKDRQRVKTHEWETKAAGALQDLQVAINDFDFNPNSGHQVAQLIYDVLGAQPIKGRGKYGRISARSVDEKVLTLIQYQHPLFRRIIDMIWAYKKPENLRSKYGTPVPGKQAGKWKGLFAHEGRFLYGLSESGTISGRFASRAHHYWVGTNTQNVPGDVRDMMQADVGYCFFEADYSGSDAFFVAFESQDENMIANVLSDKDTHCIHAEFFFKKTYEVVYKAYKNHEDWAVNAIYGVRPNTKRITHGANYRMAGYTLFVTMGGRDAVVGTAKAMGHDTADKWGQKQLVEFCGELLRMYVTQLYPRLPTWYEESQTEAKNNGNRLVTAFGYNILLFGNILSDSAVQRKLTSLYGQGGTSGNINRALRSIFYESDLRKRRLSLVSQTHDSIMSQIPLSDLAMCKEVLTHMGQSVTIKGRTFTVPTDASIGLSWGKDGGAMMPWREDITEADLIHHEMKWQAEKYNSPQ